MHRFARLFFVLIFCLSFMSVNRESDAAAFQGEPNVIFIIADDKN
jgi:hypothetical protein